MRLSVMDRMMLLQALPPHGNITTLRIVRELRESLSFTEKEHKEYGIKQSDDGRVSWNAGGFKEIAFGEKATDIIVDTLKKLNDQDKLTENHVRVYELFVEGKPDDPPQNGQAKEPVPMKGRAK